MFGSTGEKISVIVPIYRGNVYIAHLIHMLEENWEAANKVQAVKIELVLVNDYPEEELTVKTEWIKKISWKVIINRKNCGIHFSRVQGYLHSDGEYLLFLDQDDEISPIYIREQLNGLDGYDAMICNGKNQGDLIYRNSGELNKAISIDEYKNGYNRIVSPGQVLLRKKAIPKDWLEHILLKNGADDYFLWLLMFCKNCKIGIQNKALYWHRISGENTSRDLSGMNDSVFEMAEKMTDLGYLTHEEEIKIRKARPIPFNERVLSLENYEKQRNYVQILEIWMTLRDRKVSIDSFLKKNGIRTLAIYGAGILGKHLFYELQESNIQVKCFLDQKKEAGVMGVEILPVGVPLEFVDAIIITPCIEFIQIKKRLERYYFCSILSIEEVLLNADCELMTE